MSDTTRSIEVRKEETEAALRYAQVIEWSSEDNVFVVSVPDIPGLHTHGATREQAAAMGDEAIALWLAGARETGIAIPDPTFSALRADTALADTAERVRRIRQRLDASQRELAKMLNVSVGTVRSWEQGLRTPDGASRRLLEIAERQPEILIDLTAQRPKGTALAS